MSTRENNFQSRPDCGGSGGAVLAPVDQKTCRQVFSQGARPCPVPCPSAPARCCWRRTAACRAPPLRQPSPSQRTHSVCFSPGSRGASARGAGPASAFVAGKSISTGTKFDSGTVCNKIRRASFPRPPALNTPSLRPRCSGRRRQQAPQPLRAGQGTEAVARARSQYGYFFVTTNCSTFPAASNQALSSFFAYSSYPSDGCASVFPEYSYGSGHSVSRVRTLTLRPRPARVAAAVDALGVTAKHL